MSSWIEYKGYASKVEYSAEDGILFGRIEGIADLVTFEAETTADISQSFHDAVDDYLEFCNTVGKSPEKVYKGTFNVRFSPRLHKEIAEYAIRSDCSLNDAVCQAVEQFLHPLTYTPVIIRQNEQAINRQLGMYWSSVPLGNRIQPLLYNPEKENVYETR